jgi:hypothetical protein
MAAKRRTVFMKHHHDSHKRGTIPPGAFPGAAPHGFFRHSGMGFGAAPAGIAPFPHSPPSSVSGVFLASLLAGTFSLGRNLTRVQRGELTLPAAFGRALVNGVCVNLAATAAVGISAAAPVRQPLKLAIYGGVATAASYFLHAAADTVISASSPGGAEPMRPAGSSPTPG